MTGKSDEPAVSYRDNGNGTRSIGVTLNGAFVPFVTLEGAYVEALATAYNSPEAKEARGESTEGNG